MKKKSKIVNLKLTLVFVLTITSAPIMLFGQSPVDEGNGWDAIQRCNGLSPNYMLVSTSLSRDGCIISKNGVYWVTVRNLQSFSVTLTNAPGTSGATKAVTVWNSGDHAPANPTTILDLNPRGTLGVYNKAIDAGGHSTWTSGTGGSGANILIITNWGELVLQRGGPQWDSGDNPNLNPNGRYKKQWAMLNRAKMVKGFGGIHTPDDGIQIINYDVDNITTSVKPADLSSSAHAHYVAHNCGRNVTRPIHVSQTLAADITENQSWGYSTTKGRSTTIGVEVGYEIGPDEFKGKVSTKLEHTLSSSETTTHESSSSQTKHYSFGLDADVDPGYFQSFSLLVNKATTVVPYTAYIVVKPSGYGRYITRRKINSTFTNTNGRSAQAQAGDLIKCSEQ